MKIILVAIGMLTTLSVFSAYQDMFETNIIDVKETEMDYQLELVSDVEEEYILLDCQSFINGLYTYVNEKLLFDTYLSSQECMEIGEFAFRMKNEEKPFLLAYDFDEKQLIIREPERLFKICQDEGVYLSQNDL